MSKQSNPYNKIKDSIDNIKSDIDLILSNTERIEKKLNKKTKGIWIIIPIVGSVIIFGSTVIQNLMINTLDRDVSNVSGYMMSVAEMSKYLDGIQTRVEQNQVAYNENENNLGLLSNLCNSYASYCTLATNIENSFYNWVPLGTKLPESEIVDLKLKNAKNYEAKETLKKINEFQSKLLIDELSDYYVVAKSLNWSFNTKYAKLCGDMLKAKENKRSRIKSFYIVCLLLSGLCTAISSFKAIYQ